MNSSVKIGRRNLNRKVRVLEYSFLYTWDRHQHFLRTFPETDRTVPRLQVGTLKWSLCPNDINQVQPRSLVRIQSCVPTEGRLPSSSDFTYLHMVRLIMSMVYSKNVVESISFYGITCKMGFDLKQSFCQLFNRYQWLEYLYPKFGSRLTIFRPREKMTWYDKDSTNLVLSRILYQWLIYVLVVWYTSILLGFIRYVKNGS